MLNSSSLIGQQAPMSGGAVTFRGVILNILIDPQRGLFAFVASMPNLLNLAVLRQEEALTNLASDRHTDANAALGLGFTSRSLVGSRGERHKPSYRSWPHLDERRLPTFN
jgi:hypothetical protein